MVVDKRDFAVVDVLTGFQFRWSERERNSLVGRKVRMRGGMAATRMIEKTLLSVKTPIDAFGVLLWCNLLNPMFEIRPAR